MFNSIPCLLAAAMLAGCANEPVAWSVPAGSVADAGYQAASFTPPSNVFTGPVPVAATPVASSMAGMDHAKMGHGAPQQAAAKSAATESAAAKPAAVQATGVVRSVDAAKGVVRLAHDAIPAIEWPKMVMNFNVESGVDLSQIKENDKVTFTLKPVGGDEYVIASIAAASNAQHDGHKH